MQKQIEICSEALPTVPHGVRVAFSGDWDATNVEEIVEKVTDLMNDGYINIIADFEDLRYVNSTGLGILLHFSKSSRESGGSFKVCNVNENVYHKIEV